MMNNGVKALPCRFQQCLGSVNTLTGKRRHETGPFRHLSNQAFQNEYFWKYLSCEAHVFFSKCSKFFVDLRNAIKFLQVFF